jgi:hypothetical protein
MNYHTHMWGKPSQRRLALPDSRWFKRSSLRKVDLALRDVSHL